jgi:hypothetical protein
MLCCEPDAHCRRLNCTARDITLVHLLLLLVALPPQILSSCICLIEWPQRLERFTPPVRLEVHIAATSDDRRSVRLVGHGDWWREAVAGAPVSVAEATTSHA